MEIILQVAVLIFSVMIHEIAHGYMALKLGDPTAKYAGRLTLNPMAHLDLWGSFLVPLLMVVSGLGVLFGWAKPVPYNPYNLRDQKFGPGLVGLAGPLSNVLLAVIAGVIMRTLLVMGISNEFLFYLLASIIFINILLIVFNLLPIPPLDGSKVLFTFLPISDHTKMALEQYGFVFLFVFLFFFSAILEPVLIFALNLFSRLLLDGISIQSFL